MPLQTPAQLPVAAKFNPPKLGRITKMRIEHEQAALARLAALEEKEDNQDLLMLDDKYVDTTFYDDGEHRLIQSIEWNDRYDRFQAITSKVYKLGHARAGEIMLKPSRTAYGLSERERPEMDRMVTERRQLVEKEGQKKRKREEKAAAAAKKNKKKKR